MTTATFINEGCSADQLTLLLSEISDTGLLVAPEPTSLSSTQYLKVPVSYLGSWKHSEYGDVSFTQQDFDDMIRNWEDRVTGYEPPLFLGHPVDLFSQEGAPSYAFLAHLKQEGDVLFGYYEPVEVDMFSVAPNGGIVVKGKGVYRYSSAEIVRDAKNKADGSEIGTLLVGTALTNRPFIPNLPKPQLAQLTFNEGSSGNLVFVFGDTKNMTSTPTETPTAPAQTGGLADLISQISKLTDALTTQTTKVNLLTEQLEAANGRIKQLESSNLESTISNLNLPASLKETFSDVLNNDALPAEEKQKILAKLHTLSDENAAKLTKVQGDTSQTVDGKQTLSEDSKEQPNPYAEIIAKNQALSDSLEKQRQTV